MSIQTNIDNLLGNISVFNLALNTAGILNNKKNIALYTLNETTGAKENILENGSLLGTIDKYTSLVGITPAIIDAEISETCKLAEHPLEDGKIRADNKIQMPTEITVKIALPALQYEDVWNKIQELKRNNTMILVQTKTGNYENMQIVAIPFSLNVNNVSRVTFTLRLRQVLVAEIGAVVKTAGEADTDTFSVGTVTGTETGITQFVE